MSAIINKKLFLTPSQVESAIRDFWAGGRWDLFLTAQARGHRKGFLQWPAGTAFQSATSSSLSLASSTPLRVQGRTTRSSSALQPALHNPHFQYGQEALGMPGMPGLPGLPGGAVGVVGPATWLAGWAEERMQRNWRRVEKGELKGCWR